MNKYSLNIACWNINGLNDNKLTDKDFEAFICKYDCYLSCGELMPYPWHCLSKSSNSYLVQMFIMFLDCAS